MKREVPVVGARLANSSLELTRALGEGAMGMVFAAWQEALQRTVAVKFLKVTAAVGEDPGLSALASARFRDEAQAAARIRHPALVALYDAGEDERYGPYLVFEYLAGGTLEDLLATAGPLGWEETVRCVGIPLCNALQALHEAGVIHRDVKPGNVLRSEDGSFKLGDLGLATFRDRSAKTQTGIFVGTPGYVAPEAALHPQDAPTVAYDIYATAAVVVKAATGQLPFNDGQSLVALVHEQTKRDVTATDLTELGLPRRAAVALTPAFSRTPAERPRSAVVLAELLTACTGQQGSARTQVVDTRAAASALAVTSATTDTSSREEDSHGKRRGSGKGRLRNIVPFLVLVGLCAVIAIVHRGSPIATTVNESPTAVASSGRVSTAEKRHRLLEELETIALELAGYEDFGPPFVREYEVALERLRYIHTMLGDKGELYEAIARGAKDRPAVAALLQGSISDWSSTKQGAENLEGLERWQSAFNIHTKAMAGRWKRGQVDTKQFVESLHWLCTRMCRRLGRSGDCVRHHEYVFVDTARIFDNLAAEFPERMHDGWRRHLLCRLALERLRAIVVNDNDTQARHDIKPYLEFLLADPRLAHREPLVERYRSLGGGAVAEAVTLDGYLAQFDKDVVPRYKLLLEAAKAAQIEETSTIAPHGNLPTYVRLYRQAYWLTKACSVCKDGGSPSQADFVRASAAIVDLRRVETYDVVVSGRALGGFWGRGFYTSSLVRWAVLALTRLARATQHNVKADLHAWWPMANNLVKASKSHFGALQESDRKLYHHYECVRDLLSDEDPAGCYLRGLWNRLDEGPRSRKAQRRLARARERIAEYAAKAGRARDWQSSPLARAIAEGY